MNPQLLCALVVLCAVSTQAWPYMNAYRVAQMLRRGGGGEGGFGGFGGGEGGPFAGFGGGEGGLFGGFGGGGEGGSQFNAGGEGGAMGGGGGDDEGGAAGGEGAAAGGEGGAAGGGEGSQQFMGFPGSMGYSPFAMGRMRGYGYNRFPNFGFSGMNPFFRPNPFFRFRSQPMPWYQGVSSLMDMDMPSMPDLGSIANELTERLSSLF